MKKPVAVALSLLGLTAALSLAQQQPVTLKVVGFEVSAAEKGTPLDQAYKKFLADAQRVLKININSLETPPEFDTQLLVDLAAGTAPDVWSQDASSLARLANSGNLLDMRKCQTAVKNFNFSRFFPSVLGIHRAADGAIYGVPNDFTPMVIYYNPASFEKAKVALPRASWTWNDFLRTAQQLTLDNRGRNALDPNFDANNVVQWGYRVRKFAFEWVYRLWQNGGDVISPDGSTASGYLDSPASIEAIQWHADLILKHRVAPKPSTLDQLNAQLGFLNRFMRGDFAMFDRGHWELVGLMNTPEYKNGARFNVINQPRKKNNNTVLYASGFVINKAVEKDPARLTAACQFVERATGTTYQDTKVLTGIAIAANQFSAAKAINNSKLPTVEKSFFDAVSSGRAPYGSKFANYPAVEAILDSMMERILNGAAVEATVRSAVTEINRELTKR